VSRPVPGFFIVIFPALDLLYRCPLTFANQIKREREIYEMEAFPLHPFASAQDRIL